MPGTSVLWSRPYHVPARPFQVITEDGVRLRGHRIDGGAGGAALVFCHGFLGRHTKGSLVRFQELFARAFTVYAFDFRGHGRSEGSSAFGVMEHLDVDAVVNLTRAEGATRVATLGMSMGGIAVLRHAALRGGVDAVVAVSAPARWEGHTSRPVRRLAWLIGTSRGRRLTRVWGTRVSSELDRSEDPADLIGRISPTPLILVHGRDDHFFDEENAWLLYRRALPPKRMLLASRFGHAEDGLSAALAERLTDALGRVLGWEHSNAPMSEAL